MWRLLLYVSLVESIHNKFLELVQVQQEVFQEAGGESLTRCLEATIRCGVRAQDSRRLGPIRAVEAGRLRLKRWLGRSRWRGSPRPLSSPAYPIGGRYPFQRKCGSGNFLLGNAKASLAGVIPTVAEFRTV